MIRIQKLTFALFLALSSVQPARSAPGSGTLDIYWVDVEGGAATLVVTPDGESVLIDTGLPGDRDPGRIHRVAVEAAGLERIDHLVTTHFDLDHFGGAAELSKRIPIGTVYDNGVPDENESANANRRRFLDRIRPYREFEAEERKILRPGDEIELKTRSGGPRISLRCLGAAQQFAPATGGRSENPHCAMHREKEKDTSENANSIVLLLQYGPFDLFLGGDLTWNLEAELVCPVNRVGEVDVYQVDHHGLDQSNNPVLVRSLAPTVSIMSNGIRKGCGAETFATLQAAPSIKAMYQIHRNLRADGENNAPDEYIANLEEQCAANFIKLSVSSDGRTYTVSIPATGHQRTFQSE